MLGVVIVRMLSNMEQKDGQKITGTKGKKGPLAYVEGKKPPTKKVPTAIKCIYGTKFWIPLDAN